MLKACAYAFLIVLQLTIGDVRGNGYGNLGDDDSGSQGVKSPHNSAPDTSISSLPQYESAGTSDQNYWWQQNNPFRRPANHPGVEKGDSPSSRPQQPNPYQNQNKLHPTSHSRPNVFTPPQQPPPNPFNSQPGQQQPNNPYGNQQPQFNPQPNNQFQQNSPAFGSPSQPNSSPFGSPSAPNPPQNKFPLSVDEGCQLQNKADCHGAKNFPQQPQGQSPPSTGYEPPRPSPFNQPEPNKPVKGSPFGANKPRVPPPSTNYKPPSYGASDDEPSNSNFNSKPESSNQFPSQDEIEAPSYGPISNDQTNSQPQSQFPSPPQPKPQNSPFSPPSQPQNNNPFNPPSKPPNSPFSQPAQPQNSPFSQPAQPQNPQNNPYAPSNSLKNPNNYQQEPAQLSPQSLSPSQQRPYQGAPTNQFSPSQSPPQRNPADNGQQPFRPNPSSPQNFNNQPQRPNNFIQPTNKPYKPANQPQSAPAGNNDYSEQLPYPGCPAAMLCVPETRCNIEGVIEERSIQLSQAEKDHRVALMACSHPMTGVVGVCCRDPNYKDPWPDMNMNGMPKKEHHHHPDKGNNFGGNPGNPSPFGQPSQQQNSPTAFQPNTNQREPHQLQPQQNQPQSGQYQPERQQYQPQGQQNQPQNQQYQPPRPQQQYQPQDQQRQPPKSFGGYPSGD